MAKKMSDEVLRRREEIRRRIEWVLVKIFHGRQRRMAESLGMSQSLISRIVHGQQGAGPDFLAALAGLPGLNPTWVSEGTGDPLLPQTTGTLPIAMSILPGWPERYPELLTGERHPVAEAFERPSRYWLAVPPSCSMLKQPDLALLAHDLLLLDANRVLWETNLATHKGRLFGAKVQRGNSCALEMGRLGGDTTGLFIDLVGEVVRLIGQGTPRDRVNEHPTAEEQKAKREAFHQRFQRPRRKVRRLNNLNPKPKEPNDEKSTSSAEKSPEVPVTQVDVRDRPSEPHPDPMAELVAMMVYMVRPQ